MRCAALVLLFACDAHALGRGGLSAPYPPLAPKAAAVAWTAVGDSTTKCCNTEGWPVWFARACAGRTMENNAVAGATTADIRDEQWPIAKLEAATAIAIGGGFNDIQQTSDSAAVIFARLRTVADEAHAMGWQVVFVSPLPAGGIIGAAEEVRRLALAQLEFAWAQSHGQTYIDPDKTLINCGIRYGDGAQALCDFASTGDLVHPSVGGQAVIGTYMASKLGCLP